MVRKINKKKIYFYRKIKYTLIKKFFNSDTTFYKLLEYRKGVFNYYPWYENKNFNLNKLKNFIFKKYFSKKYDYNRLMLKANIIYLSSFKKILMNRFNKKQLKKYA